MAKTKRRRKEAEVISETVDFREELPGILAKVTDVADLEAWKKAYPEVEFPEIDEGMSGKPIGWEDRKPEEIAVYVAYWRDPQKAEVVYEISADEYRVRVNIDDSERVWWLWLSGCFSLLGEEASELSEDALQTLIHYAAQQAGQFEEMVEDQLLADDVELLSLEMKVKAL